MTQHSIVSLNKSRHLFYSLYINGFFAVAVFSFEVSIFCCAVTEWRESNEKYIEQKPMLFRLTAMLIEMFVVLLLICRIHSYELSVCMFKYVRRNQVEWYTNTHTYKNTANAAIVWHLHFCSEKKHDHTFCILHAKRRSFYRNWLWFFRVDWYIFCHILSNLISFDSFFALLTNKL